MGRKKETVSKTVPIQMDVNGKVQWDAVLKQGASANKLAVRGRELEILDTGILGTFFCEVLQIFCGLVLGCIESSKPISARKYAFDSIFQTLQDLHTFAPLESQNFSKKSV